MCQPPLGPAHPHSMDGQGAILQLVQASLGHHRQPVLAPADEGLRVTLGIAVEEGITASALHLVGAGIPLYDGCLWERERGGREGGPDGHPSFPASTYL